MANDATQALTGPNAAAGPLAVSEANPRYFTVASGGGADRKVIYLTGSHIWNNLHDGLGPGPSCAETPEQNDYHAYLDFLERYGHNFIRLWRWEHFKSQSAGGAFHLCMTPQPWPRTGPGAATDGKPKFDLARFEPAYFDRLRGRVIAAGNEGIYVAVMLFDGFALHLSPPPDHVEGHPFHAANNVNGISADSIDDLQDVDRVRGDAVDVVAGEERVALDLIRWRAEVPRPAVEEHNATVGRYSLVEDT